MGRTSGLYFNPIAPVCASAARRKWGYIPARPVPPSRSPRRATLLRALSLTAIVAASAFLGWWTWQTTAALERLGERSVIESTVLLVREKIDRVESTLIAADNAVLHLLNPDDLDDLAVRWPALAERISPTVRSVLVLDAAGRVLRHVSREESPETASTRATLPGLLDQGLRDELGLDHPVGAHRHFHGTVAGQSVLVTHFVRAQGLRRYHVLLETDLDYVLGEVLPRLFDDPLARGRFNITDETNQLVYGRALTRAGDFLVSAPFPTTLYKWRLSIIPRQAPELEQRARRRRYVEASYVGLSLLVIVVGVLFLVYAVRKEERLNQLKSDFIATVSHELKTPLSLVRMFAEMLASDRVPTPEKRAQYLDIIVRESERLSALIDNVLDFARLEGGRASYEFVEADLADVVGRAVSHFRYRQQRDKPQVELDAPTPGPTVRLDARALELMVFNLLDNAFKYAGDSETVRVRVRADGRRALLEVEDQGPGIDPEDARRVFERFYRGRAARRGQARGSGIGLALVQHIARAHGGQATVHPAAGPHGALFRVAFPAVPVGAAPSGPSGDSAGAEGTVDPRG